ncbi:hypothetical protein GQ600_26609 [Phytophthora cactorum]|nr:hypothetical protein GQ600_26609 [Phytophthora cactorum]
MYSRNLFDKPVFDSLNLGGLMRGQTTEDYRPNKRLVPGVLRVACQGYRHLDALLDTAASGARAPLGEMLLDSGHFQQTDILDVWPDVNITPLGVVGKTHAQPAISFTTNPFQRMARSMTLPCFERVTLPRLLERLHPQRVRVSFRRAPCPRQCPVIDTSAAFGWSGFRASYGIIGGATAHIHGATVTPYRPNGPFNNY